MTKNELLRRHLVAPATNLNGQITKGRIGQTHDDLGAPPEANRGFIDDRGQYLDRAGARTYLNTQANVYGMKEPFGEHEPSSEQLRAAVPIYESPHQRIYALGGNKGVSVVMSPDHPGHFEAAEILFYRHDRGPAGGFHIDYSRQVPSGALKEDEIQQYIERAALGDQP